MGELIDDVKGVESRRSGHGNGNGHPLPGDVDEEEGAKGDEGNGERGFSPATVASASLATTEIGGSRGGHGIRCGEVGARRGTPPSLTFLRSDRHLFGGLPEDRADLNRIDERTQVFGLAQ